MIIDSSDGTGNTAAPSPDPGWSYVGTRGSLTAVYLGDGWVLTANHVGAGDVTLGGVVYPYVPGTAVRLRNGPGSFADLLVFAIAPYPVMPLLPIATTKPQLGTDLILIGNGSTSSVKMFDSEGNYIEDLISNRAGGLITPVAIVIRNDTSQPAFKLNAGLNDAWFNPATETLCSVTEAPN